MYYNYEMVYGATRPVIVDGMMNYFDRLWALHETVTYQQIKTFHGLEPVSNYSHHKMLADRIVQLFYNGDGKILKWKVSKKMQILGYAESDIKTVLRNLVNDGVLWEPDPNSYALVNRKEFSTP